MEADGIGGGRKGGYTLNEPKDTRSPRFGRLNERRRAESALIEGRNTPNTPEGTISPRFGSLNGRKLPESGVIDPERHTKHT